MGIFNEKFLTGEKYRAGTGEVFIIRETVNAPHHFLFHTQRSRVLFFRESTGEFFNVRLSTAQRLPLKKVER